MIGLEGSPNGVPSHRHRANLAALEGRRWPADRRSLTERPMHALTGEERACVLVVASGLRLVDQTLARIVPTLIEKSVYIVNKSRFQRCAAYLRQTRYRDRTESPPHSRTSTAHGPLCWIRSDAGT